MLAFLTYFVYLYKKKMFYCKTIDDVLNPLINSKNQTYGRLDSFRISMRTEMLSYIPFIPIRNLKKYQLKIVLFLFD